MCTQGDTVVLTVHERPVDVDRCIAPLVQALNEAGLRTIASCCGHGRRPGQVALADGREVFVVPDYETAQALNQRLDALGFRPICD